MNEMIPAIEDHSFLVSAVIYLSAAVVCVPLSKRLGLGSVLGYLIAGILIGPFALGLVGNAAQILHFAEFGVVLLLFLIGLELNPSRLWEMRSPIFGTGSAQVVLTTLLLSICCIWLLDLPFQVAVIAAMGLSLSSTAIALQTLQEKSLLESQAGHSAFSVLLLQDIAVIPMIAVLPLLAGTGAAGDFSWLQVAKVIAVIGGIIIGGHYLVRHAYRFIASTGSREIFIAFSLLLVMGVSLLMQLVGMSMALGAFLGGLLLAESEYRHQIELDIEPFKGLLLGLFFIAVGMSIDLGLLFSSPLYILMLVAAIIVIKIGVLMLIARFSGLAQGQIYLFAFVLSQGGEFAFVLFNIANSQQVIPSDLAGTLILVAALSMLTTPLLMIIYERMIQPAFTQQKEEPETSFEEQYSPVIIAGHGRVGQIVNRLLHSRGIEATVLDHNPDHIELLRKYGYKVFYGDPTRVDLLRQAGAEQAKVLVVALDDHDASLRTIKLAKQAFPHLKIIARASGRTHVFAMLDLGVDEFVREGFHSSLIIGEKVLKELGYGAYRAKRVAQIFRNYDRAYLHQQYEFYKDDHRMIASSKLAREELLAVMEADEARLEQKKRGSGWS